MKEKSNFYVIMKDVYFKIIADCKGEAITKFIKKHSEYEEQLTVFDFYNEEEWLKSSLKRYLHHAPVEIIY